jgi:hypothetical protein
MTNQEVLQKAAITTEALAQQGKLLPEQSDSFLDFVEEESQLTEMGISIERFRNEEKFIEKMDVPQRVMVPHEECKDPQVRNGVTTSRVELKPEDFMVPFEISKKFLRHNIEGDGGAEHVVRMMATRTNNNAEQTYWESSKVGPAILQSDYPGGGSSSLYRLDGTHSRYDGLLELAEGGHVVDAQNAPISPRLVSRALRAMPNKFRKNRRELWGFMSWDHEQHYREGVSSRATRAGDDALSGVDAIPSFGVNLGPISLLDPDPIKVEHIVLNGTTPTALKHGPVTDVVVTEPTLGSAGEAAFIETTDYVVDYAAGTVARNGAGAIGDGNTVKVTYKTAGRMIITRPSNIIVAFGTDIEIMRQENIYTRKLEYAIHLSIFVTFVELDAVVLLKNVQVPEE